MIDRQTFCAEFGIDETAAAEVLTHPEGGHESPWYARAFLALGAWVTAIAIVAFCVLLIALSHDGDGSESILAILGVICLAIGLGMLGKAADGAFRRSFATALGAAGAAMTTAGIGLATEDIWVSVAASVVLAGIVVLRAPGMILQLLASGFAVALIAAALVLDEVPYFLDIAALLFVVGAALWLRPPRRDMRPTAFALLVSEPALSIFVRFDYWSDTPIGGWVGLAAHIALFGWLVSVLWRHRTGPGDRLKLGIFAVAAVAVVLLMPPGGSGALVIMTLAFVLGSRPLALLGILLQAYFFWQFYYDLGISLLNKSLLLTAVGLVVLACWWLVTRAGTGRANV